MMGLLERDVLVIGQKAKLIEMTDEYRILDPEGVEVGSIRQEGQSKSKKLFRLVTDLGRVPNPPPVRLRGGRHETARDRTTRQGLQVHAEDPRRRRGGPRSSLLQDNVLGKKHFSLRGTGGELLGWIEAENWRSWDFVINDAGGAEVSRSPRSGQASSARGSRRPITTSCRSPGRRSRNSGSCSSHRQRPSISR